MRVPAVILMGALLAGGFGTAKAARVVVLADFSQDNGSLGRCYEETAGRVLLSLRPGDHFNFGGFAVDDKEWFPVGQALMSRPGYANAQKRLLRQQIRVYVDRLRHGEFKAESAADLAAAVREAAALLAPAGGRDATLIVLSDFSSGGVGGGGGQDIKLKGVRVLGVTCSTAPDSEGKPDASVLKSWQTLVEKAGGSWLALTPDQLAAALAVM